MGGTPRRSGCRLIWAKSIKSITCEFIPIGMVHDTISTQSKCLKMQRSGRGWSIIVRTFSPRRPRGTTIGFPFMRRTYIRVNLLQNSANDSVHLVELMVFEAAP